MSNKSINELSGSFWTKQANIILANESTIRASCQDMSLDKDTTDKMVSKSTDKAIEKIAKDIKASIEDVQKKLIEAIQKSSAKKANSDDLVVAWTAKGLKLQMEWLKAVNACKLPEQEAFTKHCNAYFSETGKSAGNRTDNRIMLCSVVNKDGSISVYGGMWDNDRIQHFLRLVPHANSPISFEDAREAIEVYLAGNASYVISPVPVPKTSGRTITEEELDKIANGELQARADSHPDLDDSEVDSTEPDITEDDNNNV